MKNIQDMHEVFNLILDTYNEPYFEPEEIDSFINQGQLDLVSDMLYPEHIVGRSSPNIKVLYEASKQSSFILHPLSYDNIEATNIGGSIHMSSLNSELRDRIYEETGIQDSNESIIHISSVNRLDPDIGRVNVRFYRSSDISAFRDNVFKRPSKHIQYYTVNSVGIGIDPVIEASYFLSVIKSPREVSLHDGISSDLPYVSYPMIMAYALNKAGVASRDDIFLRLKSVSGQSTERN